MNKREIIAHCAKMLAVGTEDYPNVPQPVPGAEAEYLARMLDLPTSAWRAVPDDIQAEPNQEDDPFDFHAFRGDPTIGVFLQGDWLWVVSTVNMMGHDTLCHFQFLVQQ